MKQHTTFLYLSFNSDIYHRQTTFSILSLLYYIQNDTKNKCSILLYTDNIDFYKVYFSWCSILEIRNFNNFIMTEWLNEGSKNSVMNDIDIKTTIKLMSIVKTLQEFKGKVVFVDDDTYFISDPEMMINSISADSSIMYLNEGVLCQNELENWEDLKKALEFNTFNYDSTQINIPLNTPMWNAGVIGISYSNLHLVTKVLTLASQLHKLGENPRFYHDQIMFSYVLQNESSLLPANDFIYHYCYGFRKENFNKRLNKFFKKDIVGLNSDDILKLVFDITQQEIPNKPIVSIRKKIISFFLNRKIGLYLAFERVKKTKKFSSFFERGG